MVTEHTRNQIWQEMMDASAYVRYYERLLKRDRTWYVTIRTALLVSPLGGSLAFIALAPNWVQITLGVVISIIVGIEFVTNFAKRVSVLNTTLVSCTEIEQEWEDLWNKVETFSIDDVTANEKIRYLKQRELQATSHVSQADVKEAPFLKEEIWKEAYDVAEGRYKTNG